MLPIASLRRVDRAQVHIEVLDFGCWRAGAYPHIHQLVHPYNQPTALPIPVESCYPVALHITTWQGQGPKAVPKSQVIAWLIKLSQTIEPSQ